MIKFTIKPHQNKWFPVEFKAAADMKTTVTDKTINDIIVKCSTEGDVTLDATAKLDLTLNEAGSGCYWLNFGENVFVNQDKIHIVSVQCAGCLDFNFIVEVI